jgi:hypothetical protein
MSTRATHLGVQQLFSYMKRSPYSAHLFITWFGSDVLPGSENWTWHERTVQAPRNASMLMVARGGVCNFLMIDLEGNQNGN